ncbi:hypothetical protein [Dokdonella sp.]|uniref:hypothetical protein n=1 Tax=Dokdonella sp. TaxID=2291710 RepID=UPI0025C05A7A|nr:hypothetical protein [Dokdonella sp.]MBX3688887.1 hypothetical protein [Dokdonella sp.]MBZ0224058.1 hypothetical protein [Dokdonella sp.]MCC7254414.1 hypothetical protein [Dokdonella sp.]
MAIVLDRTRIGLRIDRRSHTGIVGVRCAAHGTKIVTAIARELTGFVWAIVRAART